MRLYLLILIYLPGISFAQREGRSKYEVRWALAHPFAAVKVKKLYKKALPFYMDSETRNQLDKYESGGKTDAFRHVFFMAVFSQKIKTRKIRKLGIAHEKANKLMYQKAKKEFGSVPDSMDTVMDLYNNEIGFTLGKENRKLDRAQLSVKVLEAIKQGKARMMKRDRSGNYLTCQGDLLKQEDLSKWVNAKCLVQTDWKE